MGGCSLLPNDRSIPIFLPYCVAVAHLSAVLHSSVSVCCAVLYSCQLVCCAVSYSQLLVCCAVLHCIAAYQFVVLCCTVVYLSVVLCCIVIYRSVIAGKNAVREEISELALNCARQMLLFAQSSQKQMKTDDVVEVY